MALLLGNSLYYRSIVAEDDGRDRDLWCSKVGDEAQYAIEEQLQQPVHKAATEDMSEQESESLPTIFWRKKRKNFKFSPGRGGPGDLSENNNPPGCNPEAL